MKNIVEFIELGEVLCTGAEVDVVAVVNSLLSVVLRCLVDESVDMGVLDVDEEILVLDDLGINEERIVVTPLVVTGVTFGFILLIVGDEVKGCLIVVITGACVDTFNGLVTETY